MTAEKGTQEDAGNAKTHLRDQRAFDKIVKQNALWLLMNYRTSTGKKWGKIRNEMIDLVRPDATTERPIVLRQDLEGWAAGASVLSDPKFQVVYDFLTSESTLQRIEFESAKQLLSPQFQALMFGRSLAGLFANPGRRTSNSQRRPGYDQDGYLDRLCGLYVARVGDKHVGLGLTRLEEEPFLVAQLMFQDRRGSDDDWNMDRVSGYFTVGRQNMLFLGERSEQNYQVYPVTPMSTQSRISIVMPSYIHKICNAFEKVEQVPSFEAGDIISLTPSDDEVFSKILAAIRLDMGR